MIVVTIDELSAPHVHTIRNLDLSMEIFFESDLLNTDIPLDQVKVLLTYGFDITEELLDKMSSLKWVQVFQTGVEHVPISELEKRNITLTNVRGIYGDSISEYVMGIILYHVRNFSSFIENKKKHIWDRQLLPDEVNNKTISILGAGIIGREVAKKAKAFGMNVLGVNTSGRSQPNFDEMFSLKDMDSAICRADYIVALLPVTSETYQCIGSKQFSKMKQSAYFINVGRGELVDENALIKSLINNEISGAALDVFQQEPLPKHHPLWEVENLIITPHLSGKTIYFYDRCIKIFSHNLHLFKSKKELLYSIDVNKGY
ncbi:D-2-hydroxyacid dehydrogenase [Metabacillus sp. B2-18]|uniref:D-2-hydroxyacid dehydrogenase n=1 Tax=Metabacillus sp. B2-18 TaxID=2897333 RepID=UPI001E365BEE|nr:D-2-hydroxyacid dehydrogenase [Metabacillus sp. B2-18]UGB32225.1 D-2-hydroxyacid dehydrogenase [Metabacillus sp. B2-18]